MTLQPTDMALYHVELVYRYTDPEDGGYRWERMEMVTFSDGEEDAVLECADLFRPDRQGSANVAFAHVSVARAPHPYLLVREPSESRLRWTHQSR